jgi:hypothetical protein
MSESNWTTDRPTEPGEYWRQSRGACSHGDTMTPDQEHKLGNRAAVLIIVTLCALCVLASLNP